MTDRERELLNYIKDNPMISQAELAKRMKITRSSVSVHISNLMKKGYVKGKGYVISEIIEDVVVIGGSNMDITGHLVNTDNPGDSNPGEIKMAMGGVGRNIAENLAHLGLNVFLLSAVGDDVYGHEIYDKCEAMNINMSMTKMLSNYNTSVYMQILNQDGELNMAVSDMKITQAITVDDLIINDKAMSRAKAIVVDGNMDQSVIEHLAKHYGHKLFFEPVSMAKAEKITHHMNIYCMTPNLKEAEVITGQRCSGLEMAELLRKKGVKLPIITQGEQGVIYYEDRARSKNALASKIVSVTGAGDALMAGIVYGFMKDHSISDTVECGLKLAKMALETKHAVNMDIKKLDLE